MTTLRRLSRDLVRERGSSPGTDLEDAAARFLHGAGFRPGETAQQHPVGRYRLDFAFPDVQIGLEVDGWHHRSPEGAAIDVERDSWLRSQGWIILRIDDRRGPESFLEQLARVCRIVHQVRQADGR